MDLVSEINVYILSDKNNYRPKALSSVISKVFENCNLK